MNKKRIYNIISSYPVVSTLSYRLITNFWKVKSKLLKYDFDSSKNPSITEPQLYEYNSNRIFGPKKRFCYAPFNNLHFNVHGDVGLCSFNSKLTIGNIKEDSLESIWNNQLSKSYKEMMSNYDLSRCLECKLAFSFKNYSSLPTTKYDYHADDNIVFPNQMSFEISNLCNLECIMCNEDLSSSIRKTKGIKPLKNPYDSSFIEQLKIFIPHLKIATFIGGEPLLIKSYYNIWDEIIRTNPNCEIHVQTNATILPAKFLSLIDSGNFNIGISIDAITKETLENIRIKSIYSDIFNNINKYIELYTKRLIHLNINFCLMSNNWQELPLMLDFCNRHNVALKVIHINSPIHLDIKNLKPIDIEQIYNSLSTHKISQSTTNIITRNIRMYFDALNNIKKYIGYSNEIQEFIYTYKEKNIKQLLVYIKQLIFNNQLFDEFSTSDKYHLFNTYNDYILNVDVPDIIRENICKRFIHHILKNEHIKTNQIDIDTFMKILDGYCQIEIKLHNNNI